MKLKMNVKSDNKKSETKKMDKSSLKQQAKRKLKEPQEDKQEEEEEEKFPSPQFEQGWESMKREVAKLQKSLEDDDNGMAFEPLDPKDHILLYTTIYNMCIERRPGPGGDAGQRRVYHEYKLIHESYCTSTLLPSLQTKHHLSLLRDFVRRWSDQKIMTRWLSHFFSYLDRFYVPNHRLPDLNEVGLNCFRELVYKPICAKIRHVVVGFIGEERRGERIDRGLLKNVLDVFVQMGASKKVLEYYESDFEEAMLGDTAVFYSGKASEWIAQDTCPGYMLKVEECLESEKERVLHYLHSKTEVKLISKVEHVLLSVHANQLLEKEDTGCFALLRDDRVEDLSRMYRLFLKLSELNIVASMFKEHITALGMALIKQAEYAASNRKPGRADASASPQHVFVEKVLQLHDKYLGYVSDCFADHTLFHKALKEAFEVFCNKNIKDTSSAEILAIFCDNILKKGGSEKLGYEATEDTMEKIVKLLAYLSDKDLFAEFARKKLARRLLFDKTGNDEHQRSLLMKLKQQFGLQFTSKMEGMLTDITLTKELQTEFESYLKTSKNRPHKIDFAATVLTTGSWPSYKSSDLNLPVEMVRGVEIFKEFYEAKTTNRKLNWIYSLGTCNINGNFERKTIELIVTTYQAATLLLFNNSDTLTYSEIREQLNLMDDDVIRLLHSLSCAKYNILNKEPNTNTVGRNDVFKFNYKFTDKMRRIKVPLPPVNEKMKVVEDVTKDRRYAIDASICRIMKSRKVLSHQQLVVECVEQLNKLFKPDFKFIKKRIEDLITRDYLERDATDPNTYKYIS